MPPAAFSPLGRAHVLLRTLRPSKWLRPCWTGLFEHSIIFFREVSITHYVDEKAKDLRYSKAPQLIAVENEMVDCPTKTSIPEKDPNQFCLHDRSSMPVNPIVFFSPI
jgi:hypothetical protein